MEGIEVQAEYPNLEVGVKSMDQPDLETNSISAT